MILGLDISSSIIGLAVIDDKKLVYTSHFDLEPDKKRDHNLVFDEIKKWLNDVKTKFKITKINVEEPMKRSTNGKTSINVLALIFKVNFIVCRICYELFGFSVVYVNAASARKKYKILNKEPLKRNFQYYSSTKDIKKYVLERTLILFPSFEQDLTFSKNGIILGHNLDIADAIVMAYYES